MERSYYIDLTEKISAAGCLFVLINYEHVNIYAMQFSWGLYLVKRCHLVHKVGCFFFPQPQAIKAILTTK